jgi:nucleotide-binding universal stress UspA family protein
LSGRAQSRGIRSVFRSRGPAVLRGYRRVLVPVVAKPESHRAVDIACRLAVERRATIAAVAVIEVSPLLPLDAHMFEEEEAARGLLEGASATGDSFGVRVSTRVVRTRDAGNAIVDLAVANRVELLVIGAERKRPGSTGSVVFGRTVEHVLRAAPCRVMVVAAPGTDPAVDGREELRDRLRDLGEAQRGASAKACDNRPG